MIIYVLGGCMLLGLAYLTYQKYIEYNEENAAKAIPIADQLNQLLDDHNVTDGDPFKLRVSRIEGFFNFAFMMTTRQNGLVWDFNMVHKKIASDPNECMRLQTAFHCKNSRNFFWALTPKDGLTEDDLEGVKPVELGFDDFEQVFLVETNSPDDLRAYLSEDIRKGILEVYEQNKGNWRLQNKRLSYNEPYEMDSDEKRLAVYKIIELGKKLAKKVDV